MLTVDEGAKRAIERRAGSLLPSGVTKVEGTFKRGDVLEIRDSAGDVIARGQTNFSSAECRKLAGCHSNEIRGILGCDAEEEIIHRNSLAVVH